MHGRNYAAVELLITKWFQHGFNAFFLHERYLYTVCKQGDLRMVQKFLPNGPEEVWEEDVPAYRLTHALSTPSVEVFEQFWPISTCRKLDEVDLARLLENACQNRWEEMVRHLIGLGAPVDSFEPTPARISPASYYVPKRFHSRGSSVVGPWCNTMG